MRLTSTHLRYLLAIYDLSEAEAEAGVRCSAVAKRLGVSGASVSRMLGVLAQKQLIERRPYGRIHLTEQGRCTADHLQKNVQTLCAHLTRMGLPMSGGEARTAAFAVVAALPRKDWAVE